MNSRPLISVIVPFFNEEKYIEDCIKSILGQDFDKHRYEVIFVNNNSTDRSPDIARKYGDIKLLEEKVHNVYTARNRALKEAKGDIIAFTDADCVVNNQWLREIYKAISVDGADILLGKRLFAPEASYWSRFFEDYENVKIEYVLKNCKRENFFGFSNNMAVSRRVFDELGPFNDELLVTGDAYLVFRYAMENPEAKIVFSEGARISHLEILGIFDWTKKMYLYGRMHSRTQKITSYCNVLSTELRMRIYFNCAKKNGYSFIKKLLSFMVLSVGAVAFKLGFLKGR